MLFSATPLLRSWNSQDHMTAEHHEMMADLMNQVFSQMVTGIAQSRGLTEERVRALLVCAFSFPPVSPSSVSGKNMKMGLRVCETYL